MIAQSIAILSNLFVLINNYSQCSQMVYFQNKNPNLGKFWKVSQLKMLVFLWSFCLFCYIMVILRPFCRHLVYFFPFWYVVPRKIWQLWFQRSFENIQYICDTRLNKTSQCAPLLDSFGPIKVAPC
jgi:hypothetical protein